MKLFYLTSWHFALNSVYFIITREVTMQKKFKFKEVEKFLLQGKHKKEYPNIYPFMQFYYDSYKEHKSQYVIEDNRR